MNLRINDLAPDFTAHSTEGEINFHEWLEGSWAVLFSHPKDFTPVCTTELGCMASMQREFDQRFCKIMGLSTDSVEDHEHWCQDIEETQGFAPQYPIVADTDLRVAKLYGMLPAETTSESRRSILNVAAVRTVFIIGKDKRIKLMMSYPMSTGRNFEEILRVLDSIQLTAAHNVATPVNWKPGEDVIIPPSVSDDDAKAQFPEGWKALKPYLRVVKQPSFRF